MMGGAVHRQFAFVFLTRSFWLAALILSFLLSLSNFARAGTTNVEPAIAFAARVVGDTNRARLIVDFNREVSRDIYLLDAPRRIVIDLPETLFSLSGGGVKLPSSFVSKVRFGTVAAGKSRIVLELASSATINKHFIQQLSGTSRFRLIVDLDKASDEKFTKNVRILAPEKISIKNKSPAEEQYKIVLDPGHGGIDGGATGFSKSVEKSVVLNFALKLQEELERNPSFNVILTRNSDSFIGLRDRVAIARRNKADLLISIHADTLSDTRIRGATVYSLSDEGSDELSRILAKKQNKADLAAGLSLNTTKPLVTDILIDLTRRETERFSVRFAELMVRHMKGSVKLIHNPHRSANFFVLKAPEVPSVLLELGYLSNRKDEALMISEKWQDITVVSVKKAVESFFASRRSLP